MARSKNPRTSIRDVARESGVSLTTVSLILNKGDQRISQATRDRVLEAINKLGYRPNRLAQGLQNRRSRILGVLVPHLNHTFADVYFGELLSGIYDQANEAGYKILLEAASEQFMRRKQYIELFDRCFIDGMLFLGSHDWHAFVYELAGPERPLILVNNSIGDLDHVMCDYAEAGRLAAEHLLELGHRRIGLICGPDSVKTARELQESFLATLAGHDVIVPPQQIAAGDFLEEGGAEAIDRILKQGPAPTAVFAGNDKMAIGAMQRLIQAGRRVPEEISLMGCDGIRQAAYMRPSLTTIQLPLYELGRRCCKRMIERLRGRDDEDDDTLPVELVRRDSTAPPSHD